MLEQLNKLFKMSFRLENAIKPLIDFTIDKIEAKEGSIIIQDQDNTGELRIFTSSLDKNDLDNVNLRFDSIDSSKIVIKSKSSSSKQTVQSKLQNESADKPLIRSIPLEVNGNIIGVFNFKLPDDSNKVNDLKISMLSEVASDLSLLINDIRQREIEAEAVTSLYEMVTSFFILSEKLKSTIDIKEITDHTLEIVLNAILSTGGYLALTFENEENSKQMDLIIMSVYGIDDLYKGDVLIEGLGKHVERIKDQVIIDATSISKCEVELLEQESPPIAIFPIKDQNNVYGVIGIKRPEISPFINAGDINFLKSVCNFLAIKLKNIQNN